MDMRCLLLLMCLGALACQPSSKENRKKVIESLIITDFAVTDTIFSHSVFLKINGKDITTICKDYKDVGFVTSPNAQSNIVFDDVYKCQKSFSALSVPLKMNSDSLGSSRAYYKLDLYGVSGYHDADMILRMHAEYFASDFTLITASQPDLHLTKTDDFKIYYLKYGELVEMQ